MTFPRVNPLDSRHPRHRAKGKREWNPPQESPKSQRDDGGPPRGERESVSESLNPADDVGDFWTRKFRLFFNSPSIPRNQREKKRERERKEERERENRNRATTFLSTIQGFFRLASSCPSTPPGRFLMSRAIGEGAVRASGWVDWVSNLWP